MDIRIVKIEQISPQMERWLIQLPKHQFIVFGFLLEAMEGTGLHRQSLEAENQMVVDVAIGMKQELTDLLDDLKNWQ